MKAKILQRNQRNYNEKQLYLEIIIISTISLLSKKIFYPFMVFVKEITKLKDQFKKGAVRE